LDFLGSAAKLHLTFLKAANVRRCERGDLFLDTPAYNAHSTGVASWQFGLTAKVNALWAGVPILTLAGEKMASRVASSLNWAVGATQLIARNIHEYFELGSLLASSRNGLLNAKALLRKRESSDLFNVSKIGLIEVLEP
jgi:protein O-GlcNAc transferase